MAKRNGAHARKVQQPQDNHFFSPFIRKNWRSIVAILVAVAVIAGAWLTFDYIARNKNRVSVKDGVVQGTQPGDVLTVRGKGVPFINSSRIGDLKVIIKIKIPKRITEQQRKLLNEYRGTTTGSKGSSSGKTASASGSGRKKGFLDDLKEDLKEKFKN